MNRPASLVRLLFACLMLACLFGAASAPAWADGPTVTAVFGLGGRYRPGGWCPVTVKVKNPGADALDGQVQALSEADPNARRYGRSTADTAGASLFSRSLSVPGGGAAQTQLYAHGLDPGAGSVTVQVADGRTRGDGRVLARGSSTPSGNSLPAVTGTPVTDADLLLVGFGGDPGAFSGLSGRKLGLVHLPGMGAGKPILNQGQPGQGQPMGTAQVASVLPADLPDRAVGYSGVDAFLLRGDAPLDALSEVQADALKDWVAGGGHLVVVCPGADPGPYAASFFQGLLPATVRATGQGTLALTPKPLPGVHLLAPALITGPYGAGWVSMTTRDLAAAAPPPAFWTAALTTPRTLLGAAAAHDAAVAQDYYGYGGDSSLLSSAVLRGPSLDAPGTWVIGLFLLAYLVVLVPVNYLILKRLDRRELAWATIPALVIVFAVGTFGVGYAAKGGSVFVNRAAIVETAAGQTGAGVRGAVGLFSPRRTSYDITLTGTGLSAALPPTVRSGRFGGGGDAQASGQTRLVQTTGGAALLDTAVNMWAMRAFDFQSTTDLGGTVDVSVAGSTLTVTNHTPHALTNCQIIRGGTSYPAGPLAPGGRAQVSLLTPPHVSPQIPGLPLPQMSPGAAGGSDQAVTPRMQAVLSDYARTLGQPDNGNGYYYNGQGMAQPRTPFAPAPGEALLVGWSDDPALAGPPPRVDGKTVTFHSTTLVIVHLPLPASLSTSLPAPAAPPHVTAFHPIYFGTTSKSSVLYQKAVDARTLTTLSPKNQGKLVTVRGRSWGATDDVRHPGVTIALTPQTGRTPPFRGPTLRLLLASAPQLRPSLIMQGEFVVTGALSHPANGPQIVVGPPYQVRLVGGNGGSSITPTAPVTETGFASSRFPHIPVQNALYRQAWDVRDFAGMPKAGKPLSLRGFVSRSVLSQGQCEITLQAAVGSGPTVVLLLPAQYQIKNRDVQSLMGREVIVSNLVKSSAGTPAAPLVCQPSQVSFADNPTNAQIH